ncbi:MAG: GNAT family N-acetyltransferase [Methylocystaceae bacterium]
MNNIIIRQAQESDIGAILTLYAQPEVDNGKVPTMEMALEIFNKMSQYPNYKLYVAQANDTIMGTFALLIMDNIAHMGALSGVIEDVAVDPSCQGYGIGTQMMRFAIESCKEHGCYKVALSSNLKRKNAHDFYESLGFKKHGYSFYIDLIK